ncbi:hypothetical protein J2Z79_002769 [Symbiobacterium terraclitae]|uniref:Uncharacterized protein n=1 Tax=Symbiobacterium terraclitae TaxID=557451 RepID=A0ABS4JUV3_9FIRM|nr:hypothetical protein [Symbiobacterium terraclitae]MBP2019342.1 hypothetical protein [Symbiobacterium terraclitae]
MPPYRLAQLTDEQLALIEALENDLGLTLVAWEPTDEAPGDEEQLEGSGQQGSGQR